MKLTCTQSHLAEALSSVARVIERRNTIPILGNVRLVAGLGGLQLTGTDLDIEVSTRIPTEVTAIGETTVPAHLLHDLARKVAKDAMISLEQVESESPLVIRSGRSRFQLQTLPTVDFPDLAAGKPTHSFEISPADLAGIIRQTLVAVSTEETRYYLNGVYLHATDTHLRAVATDGHRLILANRPLPQGAAGLPGVITPRKTCQLLLDVLKGASNARMSFAPGKIILEADDTRLVSKLIDGTFPDYQRVIPLGNQKIAVADAAALLDAADLVATISSERGKAVKLAVDDSKITLSVTNPDAGSASNEIEAEYDAGSIEIGLNARYLADVIGALDTDSITLQLHDPGSPVLLVPGSHATATLDAAALAVIMPMRV
jgi:DNA polymerase III subunit beta